jgi:hypothetical protein
MFGHEILMSTDRLANSNDSIARVAPLSAMTPKAPSALHLNELWVVPPGNMRVTELRLSRNPNEGVDKGASSPALLTDRSAF